MRTLALTLILACLPATAAGPIDEGARLAATCTACHGPTPVTGNALPPLTGQSREALLASLRAFKAGTRPATIMTQLAKGYTDEQLALIAAWFGQAPTAPVTGKKDRQ
ncbi:c-type cytochrome [Pseudoduganella chitinolytica]|uniref:C-type cytochrome n=1 Tax=Pseudoduganella chitinolytica TaxID=34070 RepID=A0ABY8B8M3_9BURK|nr:c-type cytochrome [Pseudoduganella chitinolytica]WEF32282.1 c-type cytochrome [Pseudoduganella chitinolytica]